MIAVGKHAHTHGLLEDACVAVVAGVRLNSAPLELAIYRRVSGRVPELMLAGDAPRQARAQATIAAIVGYCLDVIEQGPASLAEMPQAALDSARIAARKGARIGPLLRAVEAGYQPFVGFVIAETKELPNAALVRERLRENYGGLVGDITAALEREYEQERAIHRPSAQESGSVQEPKAVSTLTRRQREVLALLSAERSYKEIAQTLHLTPNTVHTHASQIYRKLGVGGRRELHQAVPDDAFLQFAGVVHAISPKDHPSGP